jgi:hypothetical protein
MAVPIALHPDNTSAELTTITAMTLLSFILNPCDIINTSKYTFSYDFGMRIHYMRILSEM